MLQLGFYINNMAIENLYIYIYIYLDIFIYTYIYIGGLMGDIYIYIPKSCNLQHNGQIVLVFFYILRRSGGLLFWNFVEV